MKMMTDDDDDVEDVAKNCHELGVNLRKSWRCFGTPCTDVVNHIVGVVSWL